MINISYIYLPALLVIVLPPHQSCLDLHVSSCQHNEALMSKHGDQNRNDLVWIVVVRPVSIKCELSWQESTRRTCHYIMKYPIRLIYDLKIQEK